MLSRLVSQLVAVFLLAICLFVLLAQQANAAKGLRRLDASCPKGFEPADTGSGWVGASTCLTIHTEPKTWKQAQDACEASDATLMILKDEAEQAYLKDLIGSHEELSRIHLGYSRMQYVRTLG